MALKFFNVLKANAEIARLESELTSAQSKLTELVASEPEALKALQAELGDATGKLSAAETELASVKASLATAEKERDEFKAKQATVDVEVEKQASAKAAEITASQGVPPIPAKPEASSADLAAQLALISDPVKRADFIRKNRSALFSTLK